MFDVTDYMLSYIDENDLTWKELNKIQIPVDKKMLVKENLTFNNGSVINLNIPLYDYLDEFVEKMEMFILEEVKENGTWKNIEEVKLSSLLHSFNLPLCPFWLTFCEVVKTSLSEQVFS